MKKITILNQSKSLGLILFMMVVSSSAFAQKCSKSEACKDSVVYEMTFNYGLNGVEVEQADYSKKVDLLNWAKANTEPKICIKGWADTTGSETLNQKVSGVRANNLSTYLINNGVDASRISVKAMGIDGKSGSAEQARRVNVVGYFPKSCPVKENEDMKKIEERLDAIEDSSAAAAATSEKVLAALEESAAKENAKVEEAIVAEAAAAAVLDESAFSLRTNLLYWCGGLMNIGAEWNPANSPLGVVLNGGGKFSTTTSEALNLSGWFISPELRYYLGESESWFVGVQLLAGGFDVKLFDVISPYGRKGNVYAGGITGGYKLKLSGSFDMDFNLGIGYAYLAYDTYKYQSGERVDDVFDVTMSSVMPIQAGVNLIYKF